MLLLTLGLGFLRLRAAWVGLYFFWCGLEGYPPSERCKLAPFGGFAGTVLTLEGRLDGCYPLTVELVEQAFIVALVARILREDLVHHLECGSQQGVTSYSSQGTDSSPAQAASRRLGQGLYRECLWDA